MVGAERQPDADLAGAPLDGVGFDAVDADDGEQQGDATEDAEHHGAEADQPETDALFR